MSAISRDDRDAGFNLWMRERFDEVQSVSRAFIEWKFLDFHVKAISNLEVNHKVHPNDLLGRSRHAVSNPNQRLTVPLLYIGYIYGLEAIKSDLIWILRCQSSMPKSVQLDREFIIAIDRELGSTVKLLGGRNGDGLRTFVNCFGLHEELIFAPIAEEWERYNDMSKPKYGELIEL